MIRSIKYLVILCFLIVLVRCKKADEIIDSFTHFSFEADYLVSVPASPITTVPVEIVTPDIQTHSDVLFSANNTRADLVEQINLTALSLTVKTPEGGDLKFLKSVDISARAQGLPEVRVAFKDIVPDDIGGTLALDVTGADLTEYFKKDTYQLKITVTSDHALTSDYGVNAHSVFFVDAKILGQ
jgi:hypothetical protein